MELFVFFVNENNLILLFFSFWYVFYFFEGFIMNDKDYVKMALSCSNPSEAVNLLDKAIDINPDASNYYVYRGQMRFRLIPDIIGFDGYDLIISDCNKAIDLDSNNYSAYYLKGIVEYEQGKFEEALNDFDKSIELKPSFAAYNSRAGAFVYLGKYDKAIEDYDIAINFAVKPFDKAKIYANKASAYKSMGDNNMALDAYNFAIDYSPNNYSYYLERAKLLSFLFLDGSIDNKSLIIDDFNKAIELEPFDVSVYYYLSEFQEETNDFDGAIDSMNKVIAFVPNNYSYFNRLAVLLAHIKKYDDAFKNFELALSFALETSLGFIYFNYAKVKYEAGLKQDAKQLFLKAKELTPKENHNDMNLDGLIASC